jgi:hypothetical protein
MIVMELKLCVLEKVMVMICVAIAHTHIQPPLTSTEPAYMYATKLHGICRLPKGYSLVPVSPNAKFENDEPENGQSWLRWLFVPPPKRTSIACNYNIVKLAISVAQLIFACVTLYRTRGDQIEVFGYAAFGLTVAQYAWMSFVNLVGNVLCPQYPTTFFVDSKSLDKLKEAIDKQGKKAKFPIQGAVGRIQPEYEEQWREVEGKEAIDGEDSASGAALFIAAVPLAIIGGLSGFSTGDSKAYQRVWTMVWLVFGIFFGPALNVRISVFNSFTYALIWMAYAVPAIGGYVVVGQMINQYGVCTRIT